MNHHENWPMTKEEKIREDYFTLEKVWSSPNDEIDWFETAADLARKQARRVRAEKLIKFLRRPDNA